MPSVAYDPLSQSAIREIHVVVGAVEGAGNSTVLVMADALGQKGFPSFVTAPTTDNFYRVQVGPYRDDRAAESAKGALDRAGFKAIIKR